MTAIPNHDDKNLHCDDTFHWIWQTNCCNFYNSTNIYIFTVICDMFTGLYPKTCSGYFNSGLCGIVGQIFSKCCLALFATRNSILNSLLPNM